MRFLPAFKQYTLKKKCSKDCPGGIYPRCIFPVLSKSAPEGIAFQSRIAVLLHIPKYKL